MESIPSKEQEKDSTVKKKIGLVVNPIAGMGGRVGLKGTDGWETVDKAKELGAKPFAPERAVETLRFMKTVANEIQLITCPGEMGADEVKRCGMTPTLIESTITGKTKASDTKKAAKEMMNLKVDLLIFAGGDGTARDICETIGEKVPALGIPAGVKIHSGVYAINPRKAGTLAIDFIRGDTLLREAEVMDINEEAFRKGRLCAKLYGYLCVPYEKNMVQPVKFGSSILIDEKRNQEMIAEYIVDNMINEFYYILGSGTTLKAVADRLGVKKTLLGIDLVHHGKLVAMDLNERQLLRMIKGKRVKIIVTPIGGQGFIFGRGNQQISPQVIREVGKDNIIIVSTLEKLALIGHSQPLLVDTGDTRLDTMLSGCRRVITGYREEAVVRVTA